MEKYRDYKLGAKYRKIEFNLSYEDFKNFWQKSCYYCGEKIEKIGLDRIDNEKGYLIENIVSCCKICNLMKRSSSKDDFLNQCQKIINNCL